MPQRIPPFLHRHLIESRWAPLLAYAVLAVMLSGSLYFSAKQDAKTVADQSRAGCQRTNVLRSTVGVLLETAEKARRKPPLEAGDLATAAEYHRLAVSLEHAAAQGLGTPRPHVYTVDCDHAFPRP
jgi:hypothetical protein